MNERIQELIKQATHIEEPDGLFSREVFDEQKFAELIVRECIDKIENEASAYAEPVWAFELVNDIKEYFGVE